MGIWAWLILMAVSGMLATAGQYLFFRTIHPNATDYDWVFTAGGALLGGLMASVWYPGFGPVVDGLNLLPSLAGAVVLGAVVEVIYWGFIRPRQTA